MTEEGAPVAEGNQPASAAQGTDATAGYDYRKIHSYPLIKVSKLGVRIIFCLNKLFLLIYNPKVVPEVISL